MPLPSKARSFGKFLLLFDSLIIALGFFVVFPLISIHFVDQKGWTALLVGFALGLRQFIQYMLGIFGGAIADKIGAKPMIIAGMILRALGFAVMALAWQPWILIVSCVLSAIGGTLFDPPRAALAVKFTRSYERGRFFSLLMMVDSMATVMGALLGSFLLQYNFQLVCWIGAVIFIVCAIFNYYVLPSYTISLTRMPVRQSLDRVIKDKRFITYVLSLTGYYILCAQIMLMLPLIVYEVAGSASAVKWMYMIQAGLSLILLYPIASWSEKYFRLEHRLIFGMALMSLSLLPIGWSGELTSLLSLISLFYLGIIVFEPARETLCAVLANPRARGSYMGFSRLGLGIGGAIGYTGGGWLYDLGHQLQLRILPWLLLSFIGLITIAILFWQFDYRKIDTKAIKHIKGST